MIEDIHGAIKPVHDLVSLGSASTFDASKVKTPRMRQRNPRQIMLQKSKTTSYPQTCRVIQKQK